jgi:hypothetical protein
MMPYVEVWRRSELDAAHAKMPASIRPRFFRLKPRVPVVTR